MKSSTYIAAMSYYAASSRETFYAEFNVNCQIHSGMEM